ncbi:outer dynein arm-docking complex subunit 3 isoform X2 [Ambystoma mexicanum]|uniref:outer dynein arm-docking complex subunit 3 isoform X2 n=1 Tax=Ambystoma mexicanum TaxID=8296 RepID=UPI0037E7F9E9
MPVTVSLEAVKPPLHEQISELQRKIQLLEGDRKAFYESSQWTIKKNKDAILSLRQDNKKLHRKLADILAGDEKVIKEAFHNRAVEKAAMRNKNGQAAIEIVDQKVCDKLKRLNALKHQTEQRKKRLEEVKLQYGQKLQEALSLQTTDEGSAEEAQRLRILENRLEKATLKSQEADHIMSVYLKLKSHMQEESLSFQTQLDQIEAEILRLRLELKDLKVMNCDAHLARDATRVELQKHEEIIYRERREREQILQDYKKQAEERKAIAERAERRAQRVVLQPEDSATDPQRNTNGVQEEKIISTFEEAFQRIKEATGVTDTQEVVTRFIAQGDTHQHLEEMKSENEKTLVRLKEEKEQLESVFQQMKYSGEAKLSSGQQILEGMESHLKEEEARREKAKENLERVTRVLSSAKAGVEHLANKLQHVKLPKSRAPALALSVDSEEYVLDLLAATEEKLMRLLEELEDKDIHELVKQMEEEEFHTSIEGKLPDFNIRVKLPTTSKQDIFEDDDDSGDEEGDVVSRAALKRQSQQIIESKTKRRTRPRRRRGSRSMVPAHQSPTLAQKKGPK